MSSACPGVDPRTNQGDCKMGEAKLRNSPRDGEFNNTKSPGSSASQRKTSLDRDGVFMIFGDKILLIHVRLGEAI